MPDDVHPTALVRSARDLLLAAPTDYDRARAEFLAPRPQRFTWALS